MNAVGTTLTTASGQYFEEWTSVKTAPVHKGHTKRIARGAGSIFVESEIRQLLMAAKIKEARELFRAHKDRVGARPIRWKSIGINLETG